MTHDALHTARPHTHAARPDPGLTLTPTGYAELLRELEALRRRHRAEMAERLRDARAFGSPGDDDDWLAVVEDAAVDQVRISRLERLVAAARVVDEAPSGDAGAGLGSIVRVRDEAGRVSEYELVGRRAAHDAAGRVSLASPVGKALLGSRAGDVVAVPLPSGRQRMLRVLGGAQPEA